MRLTSLTVHHFRSLTNRTFTFNEGFHALTGPNAIGKTTVLEAIHLLSIGRSFRTPRLQETIQKGAFSFSIQASFERDGVTQTLSITYDGTTKHLCHNTTSYTSFTPLLGLLPSVIYSPLDIDLIHGSPEIRRRFMNVFLAQYKPSYATALFRYTHALRQRNALLKQHLKTTLSVWEETLRREATILQQERSLAIATLSERATQIYQSLTTTSEPFSILYKPSSLTFDANDLFLGYTTSGPHRDDLEFTLNTLSVKTYASEGQKRTCIAALRLAEAALLKPSLLLIDDFGIHLDHHRKQCLEEHLLSHPQLFISSPSFEKGHVIPL